MGEFQRVDKKAKAAWTLTRMMVAIIVALIGGAIAMALIEDGEPELNLLIGIVWGSLVAIFVLFALIYPHIEYIQWSYRLSDDRIEIKKGIFWRSYSIIPVARIQHVESANGVFQRMFKLASVRIYTAGGIHSIENLSQQTAEDICALLEKQVTKKIRDKEAAEVTADE